MASNRRVKCSWLTPIAAAAFLAACGGGSDEEVVATDTGPVPLTVPKVANCAAGGVPEAYLQGQVPASLRASGFKGFNCNLSLVGQYPGEGGNWSSATFVDGANRTCAYHATAVATPTRVNPGVPVIDITDRAKPIRTTSLTTASMLDPWESLKVNNRRQILIADNGQNGGGGPEIDIYDLSGDCRSPQLLASVPVGTGVDGGVQPTKGAPVGHEGNISPDGLTYYVGDVARASYYAVDVSNTTKPKMISAFDLASFGKSQTAHGMSVSSDGNRMYGVLLGASGVTPTGELQDPKDFTNGFAIFDTSEVQQRKPNAQMKVVSTAYYADGSIAQVTIPAKINGKQYLVMVDEGGSGAFDLACKAKQSPFPMARIFDISDEKSPKVVSKLMLETHDPKNCDVIKPDVTGLSFFTYGSHYCSVDNRENATVLACSYFHSGIRVFDIRNPERPKEIAYFNPASTGATGPQGSSQAVLLGGILRKPGSPDWCASRLDFDFEKKQLITMCQDNGLLVMKFADGTWPFAQSTPSREHN